MKQQYITAVLQMLNLGKDPREVFVGLEKTLNKHGHSKLFAAVLRGVARALGARNTARVVVTVADEHKYQTQKDAIDKTLELLNAKTEPTIVVDKTIVGGFIVDANSTRIDQSYKSKLVNLYRSLTK